MIVMPQSYSPSTIERRFKVINELNVRGAVYLVVYDENAPVAAIIKADLSDFGGQARHEIVASLELVRRDQCENIFSVRDFWQNTDALQVEGVVVAKAVQGVGLATVLYESLVLNAGIILMSDNTHYAGGKALWQKIAQSSTKLTVFVLDTEEGKFYPYDGTRVSYNGVSIPEAEIWSIHPDQTKHGVILVAEDAKKHAQVAA
ncbi:hypothetical protein SC206_18355 [Rouxiella sp. T17]|uniref:hypothetical protein n=1 Tax=Rouxiella sp. T17 TaxID=3085684 RepID=UPI002FCC2201